MAGLAEPTASFADTAGTNLLADKAWTVTLALGAAEAAGTSSHGQRAGRTGGDGCAWWWSRHGC